jgi:hypothetical protein
MPEFVFELTISVFERAKKMNALDCAVNAIGVVITVVGN